MSEYTNMLPHEITVSRRVITTTYSYIYNVGENTAYMSIFLSSIDGRFFIMNDESLQE